MDIPVIISRLKPFIEILGDNYPFYFNVTSINDFVDTVKKFSKRDSEEISEYKSIYKKIRSQLTDEHLSSQYLNFYQNNN